MFCRTEKATTNVQNSTVLFIITKPSQILYSLSIIFCFCLVLCLPQRCCCLKFKKITTNNFVFDNYRFEIINEQHLTVVLNRYKMNMTILEFL